MIVILRYTKSIFTNGKPWKKVKPNNQEINVEAELNDADSILKYYKQLILLRRDHDALIYGNYDLILENHDHIFAYKRNFGDETYVVLTNLFDQTTHAELPNGLLSKQSTLLLGNYNEIGRASCRERVEVVV